MPPTDPHESPMARDKVSWSCNTCEGSVSGCFKGNFFWQWKWEVHKFTNAKCWCELIQVYRQYDYTVLLLLHHLVTSVWLYSLCILQSLGISSWPLQPEKLDPIDFHEYASWVLHCLKLCSWVIWVIWVRFWRFSSVKWGFGSVVVWVFIFPSKDATKKQYAKA